MNKPIVSAIGAALALAFSAGVMAAPTMSRADYKATAESIAADFTSAKSACKSQTANAKDICMAEARSREKVATAELKARNMPTRETRQAVLFAKADGDFAVAREKCDDKAGNERKVCVTTAKAARDGAIAEAKTAMKPANAANPAKQSSTAATPGKDSPGEYVGDAFITGKVKAAVLEDPSLKSAEINVETSKGRVQLSGFVRSRADIARAVEVAKGVKGVTSVKNDMVLKGTQ
jgi:hyperosmotically inducible periplasmic protein